MQPQGSQPDAIQKLVQGISRGYHYQTLLGVTGSGKTFSMAHVIEKVQKPTIVIAHNKTLAAQLFSEYIEKDADINPKIEQMRLSATASLLSRSDVIIVASVSAIYSVGDPGDYKSLGFEFQSGMNISRREILDKLIAMQYERHDMDLRQGRFRVKGDVIDIVPGNYIGYNRNLSLFFPVSCKTFCHTGRETKACY
jgi:excinuclease ABC subunit B